MFLLVLQVATPLGRQTTLFGRDRQVAEPGRSLPSSTASCYRQLEANKNYLILTDVHNVFHQY